MPKTTIDFREALADIMKGFDEDRVLLTSQGRQGPPNAMAIGWGLAGTIWSRPVFIVLVRPSRYTYKLIEETGDFTVDIVPPSLKEAVAYCGGVSGRDRDKFGDKGLTAVAASQVKAPVIGEATFQFECRVIHKNDLLPSELAAAVKSDFYGAGDFHRVYYGEILACHAER
jgi:flavin reductase (DIM6/NTAB) family NADH-FMN oxidoreductase RutF